MFNSSNTNKKTSENAVLVRASAANNGLLNAVYRACIEGEINRIMWRNIIIM